MAKVDANKALNVGKDGYQKGASISKLQVKIWR